MFTSLLSNYLLMLDKFSQWQLFLDGHCHHWLGVWSRYQPSGKLIESYQSERIFTANPEKTIVHQKNIHHKPDGIIVNEWSLERMEDGESKHPHCQTMCTFYFSDQTVFWVPFKSANDFFGIEIILKCQSSRASVFATYDNNRKLSRFTLVREYIKGTTPIWSYNLPTQKKSSLPNVINTPGVIGEYGRGELPIDSIKTRWLSGTEREIIYFPDNIAFNVPTYFNPAKPSDLIVDWLTPTGKAERRIARYLPDKELPLFLYQSLSF